MIALCISLLAIGLSIISMVRDRDNWNRYKAERARQRAEIARLRNEDEGWTKL